MKPTVSIGIPTYNNPVMLRQAIMSVLQQTYQDFEIIICDDCSTDCTPDIVKGFDDPRIRYHRTERNLRPPRSWNVCARMAMGEYFSLLPHDDVWLPGYLEHMVAILVENRGVGFAQCAFYHTDSGLRPKGIRRATDQPLELKGEEAVIWQMESLFCNPATILFRMAAMRDMGLWREDYWDDWALIVRMACRHGFVYTPELLAGVREHGHNLCRVLCQERRDGVLDMLNQQTDVFAEALPVSPRILAYRCSLIRSLSFSCVGHALRALVHGDLQDAYRQFVRAWHLNPAVPFDPRIVRHAISGIMRRARLESHPPQVDGTPIIEFKNRNAHSTLPC